MVNRAGMPHLLSRSKGRRVRFLAGFILAFSVAQLSAQTYSLTGRLFDDRAEPLASGTVVLLNPVDSTMEFFGITNNQGGFEIRNIKKGSYLLQASYIGFRTFYSPLSFPMTGGPDVGDIVMQPLPVDLAGAEVVGEAVPLQIHGDTVIYNAAAYKTGPDASTEDLLKKLPGVEVDRAGNIKALGEDVNRLYVDGREFFGSDPTVATRNIPADAINRVQVYDKKSDEAEFTGIDDGTRDKTVNLELKEDRKKGVFGDILGGYGNDQHYKASAKAYRFTDKYQMALLGMINNVNEYGFSFNDYLDFRGGISAISMGHGSAKISLGGKNDFPVNFGEPVEGLATSGAGGLNFSHSTDQNNRSYISYLVSGSDREVDRTSNRERYTEGGSFITSDRSAQKSSDMAHRFNFGFRKRIDSTHNIIFNGNAALIYNDLNSFAKSENLEGEELVSSLLSERAEGADRFSGDMGATYYRMIGRNRSVLKTTVTGEYTKNLEHIRVNNETTFNTGPGPLIFNQFQDNLTNRTGISLTTAYSQRIAKGFYLDPVVRIGGTFESLDTQQGLIDSEKVPVDSLSPLFTSQYRRIEPGVSLRWNTEKSQLSLGINAEWGELGNRLNEDPYPVTRIHYFTPALSWDYSGRTGRKINFNYATSVNTPAVSQLLPVAVTLNPLNIFYGNPSLEPEYSHSINAHWLFFDQFSFTSLIVSMNGGYTRNKINWATTVTDNLVQINTLTNVDRDYRSQFNLNFSTPVRKLGVKFKFDAEESWNLGMNVVNDVDNIYRSFSQRYSISADNRVKKKWDVASGIGATLNRTRYDIQESLNNSYFDISWFADIRYTPTERWHFEMTADVTSYSDLGLDGSLQIPLLRAEISHYFLANNRGVFTLSGYDLLDRNQNVQRISELNYLLETRTNSIGRYVMLTFKYRLNKLARNEGIHVDVSRRR